MLYLIEILPVIKTSAIEFYMQQKVHGKTQAVRDVSIKNLQGHEKQSTCSRTHVIRQPTTFIT